MSASPFTSDGYPYPKDLAGYLPEDFGRAFFTRPDALPTALGSVLLFDGAALRPTLRASPYRYQGQAVPVYVYTSTSADYLAAHYEQLQLRPLEIGVFAWCQAEQVTFQLKLGATLQPLARLPTAAATRQARAVVPLAPAQAWSASWLLGLFALAGTPLFDPARVGPAAGPEPTFPLLVTRRQPPAARAALPRPRKRPQLDVVVGLFFDGTGNNRYATELIYNHYLTQDLHLNEEALARTLKELADRKKKGIKAPLTIRHPTPGRPPVPLEPFMVDVDGDGSTLNAYSNVVLLHDLYQTRAYDPRRAGQSQQVILRQYVQGIGTLVDLDEEGIPVKYYEDDLLGSASGRGLRGVIARVDTGLWQVAQQLRKLQQASGLEVGSLTIDVFGFSRGATAARHCLNELLRPAVAGVLLDTPAYGRLGAACEKLDVKLPATLNLRFAGLFDTVVSDVFSDPEKRGFLLSAALGLGEYESWAYELLNMNENIYTSLKDFKGKAIHLIAGDEYRANFPLTPSDAPNKCDIVLYGAHSDIGGGYAATTYKTLVTYFDLRGELAALLPSQLREASQRYCERFTRSLKKGRWEADALGQRQAPRRRIYHTIGQTNRAQGPVSGQKYVSYRYFIYDEAYLPNKLPRVALHAMLQYALAEKLPFQPDPRKARVPNLAEYALPTEAPFQAYLAGVLKLVTDPQTKQVNFPASVYYPLSEGYIHESSGYSKSVHYKTPGNNDSLLDVYVNKPNVVTEPASAKPARITDDAPPALSKDREIKPPLARPQPKGILRVIDNALEPIR